MSDASNAAVHDAPPVVSVRGLRVRFGDAEAVKGLDLDLVPGRALALVGASGSGKSVTARALLGLSGGRVGAERLSIDGVDARALSERRWRSVRGALIGTVLQDALGSLDPLRPIGAEIADAARLAARPLDLDALMREVGLDPAWAKRRPGELSGGMRQRALIAAALAAEPRVLIADEPTTALDTTRQAAVLAALRHRVEKGAALLFITHDLAAARRVADDVVVLDDGEAVERGPLAEVLTEPRSPQAKALVAAVPWERARGERLASPATSAPAPAASASSPAVLLRASGLTLRHRGAAEPTLTDVSLTLRAGETLGLVGESGSGKSTLLRAIAALLPLEAGSVELRGEPFSARSERERRRVRRAMAMIVQDPLGSFEPRWDVGSVLADAAGHRDTKRLAALLADVHLPADVLARRPRTLSGGQRQRVAIARALAVEPAVLLADEPVSALDVAVQARVLDLLDELQERRGLGIVLVSHDLGVIRHASDNIVVLREGKVVESGATEAVLAAPADAFTRELIAAAPRLHGD